MYETLKYVLFLVKHLDKEDLRAAVIAVLVELDFPTIHTAFPYLADVVISYFHDPTQSLTKEIYPSVGKRYDPQVSGIQIEKAIRYSINKAWKNRDGKKWNSLFPEAKKPPTNGQFISRIACVLELWQHCYDAQDGDKS